MTTPAEQKKAELRKANLRLGLILASVAVVFFCSFIARFAFFGH